MPRVALTDVFLRNLKPEAKLVEYWDTQVRGLCLRISPSNVRAWTFRYRPKAGVAFPRLPLGRYPEVSLKEARKRAEQRRVEVSGGGDPQADRRSKREAERTALTFGQLADAYLERYAKVHKASWQQDDLYLRVHVLPSWASKAADKISRADAAALLDKIAQTAPTSANRTQSIISKLFNWAIDSGLLTTNPVARMKKRAAEAAKDRILSPDEIRVIWRALDDAPLGDGTADALRFLLLTGQRPGEVAGIATEEVVDLEKEDGARVEIPAGRMKTRRPHVVPLAPTALEIVRRRIVKNGEAAPSHVFASRYAERGPLARHSLSQGLRRLIDGLPSETPESATISRIKSDPPTPHDFRRTVATGLSALGVRREDRLAVLAHSAGDVHATHYDKYDRLAEKRAALEAWEKKLCSMIAGAS